VGERELGSSAAGGTRRASPVDGQAAALARRFRGAAAEAWDDVWRDHFAALCAFLQREYAGLATDRIEQVAVDALARAWEHCDKYNPEKGELRPWLCTIADHAAADLCRSPQMRGRRLELAMDPDALSALADPNASDPTRPERNGPGDELAAMVDAALEAIPVKYSEVLWAFACSQDGTVPVAELAAKYGVSTAAIRQRKHRGIALLATELKRLGVEKLLLSVTRQTYQLSGGDTGNGQRGTGNGERGTGNGERGTGNGERGTGNGERGTGNGERGTGNDYSRSPTCLTKSSIRNTAYPVVHRALRLCATFYS